MDVHAESRNTMLLKKGWVALRFILFGIGGFLVMVFAAIEIDEWRTWNGLYPPRHMSPFASIPLSFVGPLMMLFGVGKWGRWGYILVFLSMPVSFLMLFLVPDNWLPHDKEFGILLVAAVLGLSAIGTNKLVDRYYDKQNSAVHSRVTR